MALTGKSPDEVFTPRRAEVNVRMYIDRPDLEDALLNAIRGSKHVVIHGESGTGKSWLYKRVFEREGIHYVVANLANASRKKSITAEIEGLLARDGVTMTTGFSEEKKALVGVPGVASGEMKHTEHVSRRSRDPFEECLKHIGTANKGAMPAVLVLDNLETIFSSAELMTELADLIILVDDPHYAKHKVKLLIVGVPSHVREYFNRTPHRASVANRLEEIREVSRLPQNSARSLVYRGFVEELQYAFAHGTIEKTMNHVGWVTDRIPQRLHEYCLGLARIAEKNARTVTDESLAEADSRWLYEGLSNAYSQIELAMNEKATRVGRRNQTLYALGKVNKADFRVSDIEEVVRAEFPNSTRGRKLNVSAMLAPLASEKIGILKKSPKGDGYMFSDPRFKMCIRAMLVKRGNEEVIKRQHSG